MRKRQIKIDQGRVIPLYPRMLITSILVAVLIYLMDQSAKPDLTFMTGLIMGSTLLHGVWSSRKVLVMDQTAGTINQYYWLMGIKVKNRQEQGRGIKVILRRIGTEQKVPGNFPWKVFLLLEDGQEVFVISRDYSEDGLKVAKEIAKKLGLEATNEQA